MDGQEERHSARMRRVGDPSKDQGEHELAVVDYTAALQVVINAALDCANQVLAYTTQNEFERAVAQANRSQELNKALTQCH